MKFYIKSVEKGLLEIKLDHYSRNKEWIAKVLAKDRVGRVAKREFIRPVKRDWSSSGRTGWTYYILDEYGEYEIHSPYDGRYLLVFREGENGEDEWEWEKIW